MGFHGGGDNGQPRFVRVIEVKATSIYARCLECGKGFVGTIGFCYSVVDGVEVLEVAVCNGGELHLIASVPLNDIPDKDATTVRVN